ncbi:inactive C-alpha-formylglycine-generating enzyme 2-like isoform X1 [Argonauta hians]
MLVLNVMVLVTVIPLSQGGGRDYDEVLDYFYGKFESMVFLEEAVFRTGVNDPTSRTGEYPVHNVQVRAFYIDRYPITNAQFRKFRQSKPQYETEAEEVNHSQVFGPHLSERQRNISTPDLKQPEWYQVTGAQWNKPEGPFSTMGERMAHPAVHLSHNDAAVYCMWAGKRLPTEHEWEYAARGGLDGLLYPWGERYLKKRMNIWQGIYPEEDKKYDGWNGTSPVDAFPPQNDYGMYDMLGNVWEWTSTLYFDRVIDRSIQPRRFVLKGGSFIDTRDGDYNFVVRTANRKGKDPKYSSSNIGFRCAMDLSEEEILARLHASTPPPRPVRVHRRSEMYYDEHGNVRKKKEEDSEHSEL